MEHCHEGNKILVRIERGEEVVSSLTEVCRKHQIGCASLTGIGAVRDAEVGYYDLQDLDYRKRTIREVCELVSITGNVALVDGEPFVHTHVALGKGDLELLGGHLFGATVAVTVEVFIDVWERSVNREHDPEMKLNLIKL